MPYPHDDAKLKSWEQGLSAQIAKDPDPWNEYDTQIKAVCAVYDKHLTGVSGYVPLDWQVIKAIAWVESGAASSAWKTAPMQIGVNGDPGLRELLDKPAGKLILPPEYAKVLTVSNVPVNGNLNFEAGVGYILKITANFGMQAQAPTSPATPAGAVDLRLPQQTASLGGPLLLDQMLRSSGLGTPLFPNLFPITALFPTLPSPPANAPPAPPPPPVHAPAHHPSKHADAHHKPKHKTPPAPPKHLAIISWKPRTLLFIAKHYNAGDGNYADKLQFALDIMSGKIKPEAAPPAAPKAPHKPKHPPMRVPSGKH